MGSTFPFPKPGAVAIFHYLLRLSDLERHRPKRQVLPFGISLVMVLGSLFLGMIGYRLLEGLSWTDAFLNASMLLGGMGPVESPVTEGGKLFAGFYALYSGLLFLVLVGVILAPFAHRVLHKFH